MSPDTEDRDESETDIETPEVDLVAAPAPESVEAEAVTATDPDPEPEPEPIDDGAAPSIAPEPESIASFAEEVREAVARLEERMGRKLEGLQSQFDREVRAEANRERIVDRLHAELQEYKQDLLLRVQRPIFVDLIQLHDDVGKMAAAVALDSEAFRGTLESIQTALEDVLYRQGVEPFRAEGDGFDPRRQRAVATVSTADSALAKTLAARIRPGFQAGDKIIRPEVVSVYTLQKAD